MDPKSIRWWVGAIEDRGRESVISRLVDVKQLISAISNLAANPASPHNNSRHMPTLTENRSNLTEPLQPQEPHNIVIVVEYGTVDRVYTDLNLRVIVVEADVIPDALCTRVRKAFSLKLKDARLPRLIRTQLKQSIARWEREVAEGQTEGGR